MKPETRRSLATLVIGVIAALGGMTLATAMRRRRCMELGGAWDGAVNACVDADGAIAAGIADHLIFWGTALVTAAIIGFMLWRLFTFGRRRSAA